MDHIAVVIASPSWYYGLDCLCCECEGETEITQEQSCCVCVFQDIFCWINLHYVFNSSALHQNHQITRWGFALRSFGSKSKTKTQRQDSASTAGRRKTLISMFMLCMETTLRSCLKQRLLKSCITLKTNEFPLTLMELHCYCRTNTVHEAWYNIVQDCSSLPDEDDWSWNFALINTFRETLCKLNVYE